MIGELTNHLWQSTSFAVAAGLLTLAFRRNKAQVRHWLWFSASMKFLLPFALLMSLGSHLKVAPAVTQFAVPVVSDVMLQIAKPFPALSSFVAPPARHAIDWVPITIFVWACGFAAIVSIRVRGWRRIRIAIRASSPIDIPGAVKVRSSPGLLEPGVVGFVRPILLLPAGIVERLTPLQLSAVLAHEMSHVRRRDNLTSAIHMIVEAIFWFHPFVWWIGSRMVEERERACDEAVLTMGGEPRIYAEGILNVCKLYVESPLACVSGVTGANLKRRIEAIMANRTGQRLNRAKKFVLAGVGAAVLVGPVVLGLAAAIGHAPVALAQVHIAVPAAVQIAQTPPAPRVNGPGRSAAAPAPQDNRLLALLFDFGGMTADEQSRTRQSAIKFVHNQMGAADRVSIMTAQDGKAAVVNDFTDDKILLESAILKVAAESATSSGLPAIQSAARLLGALQGKKALICFSAGMAEWPYKEAELRDTVIAAQVANVAIYSIDLRNTTAEPLHVLNPGGRSMSPPAGLPEDEYNQRLQYAQANFGSASSPMGRTYVQYGPPDQIDGQIWRYNYLADFHSNAEFEFVQGNAVQGRRINWPLPAATYTGEPGVAPRLVSDLNLQTIPQGEPVLANPLTGLPGRHASFQIYSGGAYPTLSVPLDSVSGRVDVVAEIVPGSSTLSTLSKVAVIRDSIQAAAGMYQANFRLPAGSYICALIVKEQATGRVYGETIRFEVK